MSYLNDKTLSFTKRLPYKKDQKSKDFNEKFSTNSQRSLITTEN